jgi:hypothetical protein
MRERRARPRAPEPDSESGCSPLYGGGAPDVAVCVATTAMAVGNGFARIVADRHYASDVKAQVEREGDGAPLQRTSQDQCRRPEEADGRRDTDRRWHGLVMVSGSFGPVDVRVMLASALGTNIVESC